MRGSAVGGVLLALTLIAVGYARYRSPTDPEPLAPLPRVEREQPPPPVEPARPLDVLPPDVVPSMPQEPPPDREIEAPAHQEPEDPFGDLAHYARYPMSDVPHSVVRAWGASGLTREPGHVGAFVVVDPAIDDDALRKLALDIRDYHRTAEAVAIRILDSEEAATYDRHVDGGELLQNHLVGRVQRNDALGTENSEVRGEPLADVEP